VNAGAGWNRWWMRALYGEPTQVRPVRRPSQAVCPHCTNFDTLTLHCPDNRCGWAACTCGALIYSDQRHRHPRHRSERDTCHDPAAAV